MARAVSEDLHLDVPRVDDGLLDEHGRVAEGGLALAHAGLDRLAEVLRVVDLAHPAATAAGHGLHEQRVRQPSVGRRLDQLVHVGGRLHRGQRGDARGLGGRDRAGLVAGQRQDVGRGADEGDAGVGARLGQRGVLGEEPVAGVDRVRAGAHRGRHDRLGVR